MLSIGFVSIPCLFCLLVSSVTVAGFSQRPQLPPGEENKGSGIDLVYDDLELTDSDRAQLISLIADLTPHDRWKTDSVREGEGLFRFVKRNYAISHSRRNKRSVETLVKIIKEVNQGKTSPLKPGVDLLIPPLPVHVYTENRRPSVAVRVFDVVTGILAELHGDQDLEKVGNAFLPKAKDPRDGDSTVYRLAQVDPLKLLLASMRRLPRGVRVFSVDGLAEIVLRQSNISDCTEASQWLASSPYLPYLKKRLAQVTGDKSLKQRLLNRAAATPLVILDWTAEPEVHGKKVESVAKYLLKNLDLPDLVQYVRTVDLNPAHNGAALETYLQAYKREYFCFQTGVDCKHNKLYNHLFQDASDWIRKPPKIQGTTFKVRELAVEAAIWQHLSKQKAWLNMSFVIHSPVLQMLQAELLATSNSFITMAADSDPVEESPTGVPQAGASIWPNFVNVTYGTPTGELYGGRTNKSRNIIVSYLGPGCGYQFESINPTDRGSSFASPYVAVSSWLKYLVDDTDAFKMRHALIRASTILKSGQNLPIESGGVFDMARLIAEDRPHIIDSRQQVVELKSGTLQIVYKKESGQSATDSFSIGDDVDFVVFQQQGKPYIRLRAFRGSIPPLPQAEVHLWEIISLELHLLPENGSPIDASTVGEFEEKVSEVVF
ncbi:MAG TPA: hypothetical protein VFQ43_09950 [Nitrososphaera sp.]|nr:hypothetical protein [Nitrososphaera sp.]